MLQVNNISIQLSDSFGLKSVSLTANAGDVIGIIGPNGAGKSTLLSCLSGFLKPSQGSIYWKGQEWNDLPLTERARSCAAVLQEPLSGQMYTVKEILWMGRYIHQDSQKKYDNNGILERYYSILDTLDLKTLENRRFETLSGGEKQRVALGKALMQEPEILLLDEPTASLDPAHAVALMEGVKRWSALESLIIIVVFHDLNLAARASQRLLLMKNGKKMCEGSPNEVFTREILKEAYGLDVFLVEHPYLKIPQVLYG